MDSHNLPYLFMEIALDEILTRTSPATLARCRGVCKTWNEATYELRFSKLLNDKTETVSGIFIKDMRIFEYSYKFVSINNSEKGTSKLSLNFLPHKRFWIEAAAKQGLLLCLNNSRKPRVPEYIICKPTTQQWEKLPNPRTRFFTLKTSLAVLGSNPFRYKIIRFSEPILPYPIKKRSLYTNIRCEIFDSTTWKWKLLPENYIKLPFCESLATHEPSVSASGFFYCPTTRRRLIAFDWEKETWEVFGLPQPFCEDRSVQLVEYEGRLGLIRTARSECMEVWAMKNYRKKSWDLKKSVDITSLLEKENFCSSDPLMDLYCSDVALMKDRSDVAFCKLQGGLISDEYKVRSVLSSKVDLFKLESDMEPVELKRTLNILRLS
ncbi:hypothetical protein TIFTF001_022175 [Ficus carica]|uniref:F-box protein n=1 Tax=Ficus carica TaxID=3494 RepID=A0AA88DCL1_FICCA|nr:hypothetical protein TIFTF001_022175 [Ficus carica]